MEKDIGKVLLKAGFSQEAGCTNVYHYGVGFTVVVSDDDIRVIDEPKESGMELVEGAGDTFKEAIEALIKDLNKHTRVLRRTYKSVCCMVDALQQEENSNE